MELTISELLDIFELPRDHWNDDLLERNVDLSTDSRNCQKDQIFWPLKGLHFDAHQFIPQMIKRGVEVIVKNTTYQPDTNHNNITTFIPVDNTNEALLKLARGYAKRFNLPKICITGSNGKTTTKEILHHILSSVGNTLATEGNFNNQIGLPLTIFRLTQDHDYGIFEMGTSEPGEIKILSKTLGGNIAVITNIGASHLEFFKNEKSVFEEKIQIAEGLQQGGCLIVNADDPYLEKLKSTTRYELMTFGVKNGLIKPKDIKWDEACRPIFKIGRTEFQLNVPGIHNLYNALAAITVATKLGLTKSQISEALATFKSKLMRTELRDANGFQIYIDCYNANPSSMKSALMTVGQMQNSGRKIAVLGDMLELGEKSKDFHIQIGSLIPEMGIDKLITVGTEAQWIKEGARQAGMNTANIIHYDYVDDAMDTLPTLIQLNDLILLKASRGVKLDKLIEEFMKLSLVEGV